uniref:Uncharacterized protein n=1 Tax=Anguilla anguilla TaxID=7936 RepID=A0A0E9VKA9_ANGAN
MYSKNDDVLGNVIPSIGYVIICLIKSLYMKLSRYKWISAYC